MWGIWQMASDILDAGERIIYSISQRIKTNHNIAESFHVVVRCGETAAKIEHVQNLNFQFTFCHV